MTELTDAQKRRDAKTEARQKRAFVDNDFRAVMNTPQGRRFVWRLIEHVTAVGAPTFIAGDTTASAYAEGRRSVGIVLRAEAQRVDRNAYCEMMREQIAEVLKAPPPPPEPLDVED